MRCQRALLDWKGIIYSSCEIGTFIALLQGGDHDEETLAFLKKAGEQPVHIFIFTDDADFRPIAVLVNSTLSNAL